MPKSRPAGILGELVPLRTPESPVSALSIARYAAEAIERGEYGPGERIRGQELADRFSCSRTPVREALRILESQGLVTIEPMCGARVVTVSDADFQEVFLLRRAIGSVIARYAADSHDTVSKERLLAQTHDLLKEAAGNGSPESFQSRLNQVLLTIRTLAGAPRARRMLDGLTLGHTAFQAIMVPTRERRIKHAQQWVQLSAAVMARDIGGAESLVRKMYDQAFRFVRDNPDVVTPQGQRRDEQK